MACGPWPILALYSHCFPSGFLSRLTPVLVNGMKYSEIDIILLKVSLCVIIFVFVAWLDTQLTMTLGNLSPKTSVSKCIEDLLVSYFEPFIIFHVDSTLYLFMNK